MKDSTPDRIEVTFAYDRTLMRRAMTGWWQSVVPPEPFIKRAIVWAVIWFCLLMLTFALSAAGLTPFYMMGGLIGAGAMIASFAYLQRTRMSRFWDEVGRHWDRAGDTNVTFDHDGLVIEDAISRRALTWQAVDAVRAVRGGTVIRSGISMLVVPDAALPAELGAQGFRERLRIWRQT